MVLHVSSLLIRVLLCALMVMGGELKLGFTLVPPNQLKMTTSSLETEDDTSSNLRCMHQILEMILVANTPSDSLDASTLLLSLSEGCDSIAIHFFSAFPVYQIKLLSKVPHHRPGMPPDPRFVHKYDITRMFCQVSDLGGRRFPSVPCRF